MIKEEIGDVDDVVNADNNVDTSNDNDTGTTEGPADNGSTSEKVKKLKEQYNKILMDLFNQYAEESLESAMDECNGAFGGNVRRIIRSAFDKIEDHIAEEMGLNDNDDADNNADNDDGSISVTIGNAEDGEDSGDGGAISNANKEISSNIIHIADAFGLTGMRDGHNNGNGIRRNDGSGRNAVTSDESQKSNSSQLTESNNTMISRDDNAIADIYKNMNI